MKFLTATILAIFALSLSASAGTIGISNGRLIVGIEAGDVDQVFAPTISGQNIVFDNLTFDIVTPGCTGVGSISCSLADFQELVILGGNGDDVINLFGISPATASPADPAATSSSADHVTPATTPSSRRYQDKPAKSPNPAS